MVLSSYFNATRTRVAKTGISNKGNYYCELADGRVLMSRDEANAKWIPRDITAGDAVKVINKQPEKKGLRLKFLWSFEITKIVPVEETAADAAAYLADLDERFASWSLEDFDRAMEEA